MNVLLQNHPIEFKMLVGVDRPEGYEQFYIEIIDGKPSLRSVSPEETKYDRLAAERLSREMGYAPVHEVPGLAELIGVDPNEWALRPHEIKAYCAER